jgi:predicted transcriptional regulator
MRAERGETVEPTVHINFVTFDTLAKLLTLKRLELLRYLHRHRE